MMSIINVIGAVEMGFGVSMTFSLYEPIKNKKIDKIKNILSAFKFIYFRVGIVVMSLGLLVMPFLRYFQSENIDAEVNIYFVYALYLLSSVVNYFVSPSKIALINAYQRRDVIHKVSTLTKFLSAVFQIITLILTNNFYYFLIAIIFFPFLRNLIISFLCSKMYPDLVANGVVSKRYLRTIFAKTKAVAIHKLGDITIISIDNILIVYFLGYSTASIYSNYIYIVTAIVTTIDVISLSLLSSVGSVLLENDKEKNYRLFQQLSLLNTMFIGFIALNLFISHQFFIELWLGKENTFNSSLTVLLFSVLMFSSKIRIILILYRDAVGMWEKDFYKPIVGVTANLLLSTILISKFGVNGVLISSIIVFLTIYLPWEVNLIHKIIFSKSSLNYIKNNLLIGVLLFAVGFLNYLFDLTISLENTLLDLVIKLIFSIVMFMCVFYKIFIKYKLDRIILKVIRAK